MLFKVSNFILVSLFNKILMVIGRIHKKSVFVLYEFFFFFYYNGFKLKWILAYITCKLP